MKKIYLIAGHHNADPGAVSGTEKESDLTKELRGLIKSELTRLEPSVMVIIDEDAHNLSMVIQTINRTIEEDDVLIDIHFNASSNTSATGTEVLVKNDSLPIRVSAAKVLSEIISEVVRIKNRGVKTEKDSARGKIAILHGTGKRYLLEVCFLSNKDDMKKYHAEKLDLAKDLAIEILKL